MGICLCKDKTEDGFPTDGYPDIYGVSVENRINHACIRNDRKYSLAETVDRLVKETLEVIGTIVDK